MRNELLFYIITHITRKAFLISIGVFVGVVILFNLILKEPTFNNLSDKAEFELKANQPDIAEKTLFEIVAQDSLNLENHFRYISAHFEIPKRINVAKNYYEERDDWPIQKFYTALSLSSDSNLSDFGYLGKGLIQLNLEHYDSAIKELSHVKNKDLKYLNNALGYAHLKSNSPAMAEQYFRREITNKGYLKKAYANLFTLLSDQNKWGELDVLQQDPAINMYFPTKVRLAFYYKSGQAINYSIVLIKKLFSLVNIWGAIAAFLIMCTWILYLRRLDIFETEKWKHIIVTVLMGMAFSFITFPLSNFFEFNLDFKLNGEIINDFIYCVIRIGAIEEFLKIVPLLLMMRFTKAVNEPYDYILYSSLSALGFAFVENLAYFNESNLHFIHGRALTAVVSHMFDSSIVAYGILLNTYKHRKNPYLNFILFFALAAISHGFYDFWLINKSVSSLKFITGLYLIVSLFIWNSFKNNALNHSNFYDKDKSIDNEKLKDYLVYTLVGILLFEYIAIAFKYSPDVANSGTMNALWGGTLLIIFLSDSLGKFSLTKGLWAPIKYWESEEKTDYKKLLDFSIKINPLTHNEYTDVYLPNSGRISKSITVSDEPDWYLIQLNEVRQHDHFLIDKVALRTKDKEEVLSTGKKSLVAFYLIPTNTDLEKVKLERTDFKFCGWAITELENK